MGRIIDRLIDIVELFIIAMFVYWFMILISRGPEAAKEFAEGVAKWIGETAEGIREAVEWVAERVGEVGEEIAKLATTPEPGKLLEEKAQREIEERAEKYGMDCLRYVHEAYNISKWDYDLENLVNEFCYHVASIYKKLLISPSSWYEELYYHYLYYLESGMTPEEALKAALRDVISEMEEWEQEQVRIKMR